MFIKLEFYELFLTCYCFFNRIKRGKVENTKVKLFKHLEPPPRPKIWVSLYLQALGIKKRTDSGLECLNQNFKNFYSDKMVLLAKW